MDHNKLKHIMILTGEPSGDVHAARLIKEIKLRQPSVHFSGIGGPCLEKEKVELFYNIDKLSVMGVTEVFMQFHHIKNAFDTFKKQLRLHPPDLIILTDYPGFNLRAAKYVKEHYHNRRRQKTGDRRQGNGNFSYIKSDIKPDIKILYFITPKVWAWKKSRLLSIKKYVDFAALIFPFEEKIFKKASIPCAYVGNPLTEEYPEHKIPLSSYSENGTEQVNIGLLPGSRKTEINNLFPIMVQAAELINKQYKKQKRKQQGQVKFLVSKASSIKAEILENIIQNSPDSHIFAIIEGPVERVLRNADMVIAASGTVTLEAALLEIPTLIIYKMSAVSFFAASLFVKVKYAGLANLITDEELMPELLQTDASPEKICETSLYMLKHLENYSTGLKKVRQKLGNKKAAHNAASIAVHMLRQD